MLPFYQNLLVELFIIEKDVEFLVVLLQELFRQEGSVRRDARYDDGKSFRLVGGVWFEGSHCKKLVERKKKRCCMIVCFYTHFQIMPSYRFQGIVINLVVRGSIGWQ